MGYDMINFASYCERVLSFMLRAHAERVVHQERVSGLAPAVVVTPDGSPGFSLPIRRHTTLFGPGYRSMGGRSDGHGTSKEWLATSAIMLLLYDLVLTGVNTNYVTTSPA